MRGRKTSSIMAAKVSSRKGFWSAERSGNSSGTPSEPQPLAQMIGRPRALINSANSGQLSSPP